ncbi:MAG: hypothetical protein A2158_03810 [Chloroflexi bacterium RBG_13_46_14]|nr:MAG: hypothetical protein A2158_03810 [Chloroflexi bacterium RBG_13_46_14]
MPPLPHFTFILTVISPAVFNPDMAYVSDSRAVFINLIISVEETGKSRRYYFWWKIYKKNSPNALPAVKYDPENYNDR